jgi:hypothetical protein
MVFFGEIHVFLQHVQIGLFGVNRVYLHPETPKFQEVFLCKTHSILTGKNAPDAAHSNTHGFLWRDTCVSQP